MGGRISAVAGLALILLGATSALAQDVTRPGMADGPDHPPNGVFHGNYCGVGDNGPGLPPTDALDEACMHHDACTPSGGLPSCECNRQFKAETHAVVTSPDQPDDLKAMATMVEAAIPAIPCR